MPYYSFVFPEERAKEMISARFFREENTPETLAVFRTKFFETLLAPLHGNYKNGAPLEVLYRYTKIRDKVEGILNSSESEILFTKEEYDFLLQEMGNFNSWNLEVADFVILLDETLKKAPLV